MWDSSLALHCLFLLIFVSSLQIPFGDRQNSEVALCHVELGCEHNPEH